MYRIQVRAWAKCRTICLNEKLCLDPARRLGLIVSPRRAQRVDLVNEDDAGFVLAGQLEQVLHQSADGPNLHA